MSTDPFTQFEGGEVDLDPDNPRPSPPKRDLSKTALGAQNAAANTPPAFPSPALYSDDGSQPNDSASSESATSSSPSRFASLHSSFSPDAPLEQKPLLFARPGDSSSSSSTHASVPDPTPAPAPAPSAASSAAAAISSYASNAVSLAKDAVAQLRQNAQELQSVTSSAPSSSSSSTSLSASHQDGHLSELWNKIYQEHNPFSSVPSRKSRPLLYTSNSSGSVDSPRTGPIPMERLGVYADEEEEEEGYGMMDEEERFRHAADIRRAERATDLKVLGAMLVIAILLSVILFFGTK
eukprot:TRINITY_DN2789_c2_g1_i1.p1 TRINITY_DN2789_c2_g1~~TRINITY_DN2789_c2_g1_i1.p1  ORF type:complete len:294 (+),score=116.39 TRINITY_DN2789_c2_g1_i1:61-942(+)